MTLLSFLQSAGRYIHCFLFRRSLPNVLLVGSGLVVLTLAVALSVHLARTDSNSENTRNFAATSAKTDSDPALSYEAVNRANPDRKAPVDASTAARSDRDSSTVRSGDDTAFKLPISEGRTRESPDADQRRTDAVAPAENKSQFTEDQESQPEQEPFGLTIAGSVLDNRGQLLAGVLVTARPVSGHDGMQESITSGLETLTDSQGMFRFQQLPEGEYYLRATGDENYRPASLRVRAGVASAELIMQRIVSVQVQGVVSEAYGGPLSQVNVRTLGSSTSVISDPSGYYEITAEPVRAGQSPVLEFTLSGYRDARRRVSGALSIGGDTFQLDVQLEPSDEKVALLGRVSGPRDEPVAAADVWISSKQPRVFERTKTNDSGDYIFENVEIGDDYRIGVEPDSTYKRHVSDHVFGVGPGDTIHDIQLDESGESWLTGEVVDPEGSPIGGFLLWARNTSAGNSEATSFQTGSRGEFSIKRVRSGQFELETRSEPFLEASDIVVLPGEARHVVVPLDWGPYWLFGQVIDREGEPVPQARIVLQWARQYPDVYSTSRRELRSDRVGYFTFSNLGAGDHTLTISAPGFDTTRSVLDPRVTNYDMQIALTRVDNAAGGGH